MKTKKITGNINIPLLGLGTHRIATIDTLVDALKIGYRHLDTATMYQNHEMIKEALKRYPVAREELFIVTKINSSDVQRGLESRIEEILIELGLSQLDCILIHSPQVPYEYAIPLLYEYVKKGVLKSIGVSNFNQEQLHTALKLNIPLVCNQIEVHPYYYLRDLIHFCQKNHVEIVSYRPFGAGKLPLLSDPVLSEIADKYRIKTSQVILAWLLNQGFIVIPRSNSTEHLKDNFHSLNIHLSKEEIDRIIELSLSHRDQTCTSWMS